MLAAWRPPSRPRNAAIANPRHRLRTTFDEVAELYDRARPTYPAEVFDDVVRLAALPSGARIVEIGCGTGKATLPLAERGFRITCVELGAQLATVARGKLAALATVDVVNARFEDWEPAAAGFDAVVAFNSFHWIDPERRYEKSAAVLRDGGSLAIVAMHHVLPAEGDPFFIQVQEDYEAVVPEDEKTKTGPPQPPDAIGDLGDRIDASGLFANVAVRRYTWDVVYSADEYVAVLDTYSGHRALDDDRRRRLYERIHRRIEARPERRVRKTYLATLNVARRL